MGEPQLPRLERWRIAPDFLKPQARREGEIVIVGEIHIDLGPQARPNGTIVAYSNARRRARAFG